MDIKFERALLGGLAAALATLPLSAQPGAARPPVIDVHFHGNAAAAARTDSFNIRYRFLGVVPVSVESLPPADKSRFGVAVGFPCDRGRAIITGVPCLANGANLPDTAWLRAQVKAGRIQAMSELVPQFVGMSPADPRLDPYWSIAEEFDLPVGIHVGTGPPNAAYESSPAPFKSPEYRASYSMPMVLEDVLMRHKGLRLVVMHAGWPMLDEMIALLYAHPGVYVDVGVLQNTRLVPRAAYYRHLRGLVDAGFAKRIIFGSDFPTGNVAAGIDAILSADFLTPEQKSDILCGNAMRFLRLAESTCRVDSPR
jgi:hypothetical protein